MEKVKSYQEDEEMQKVEVARRRSSSRSRIFETLPTKRVLSQYDVWRLLKNKKNRVSMNFDIFVQKLYLSY
jgi:hypothetical protein